ncbi:hypothetical protein FRC12_003103 [Ceratobasidium sp. 428]|nr:hypothetical protein FRC12_003103 [Ceratobasidium sp. 428]
MRAQSSSSGTTHVRPSPSLHPISEHTKEIPRRSWHDRQSNEPAHSVIEYESSTSSLATRARTSNTNRSAYITEVVDEEEVRSAQRRARREQEREESIAYRQQLKNERLMREQQRANIETRRGRHSHHPDPRVESSLHHEILDPQGSSTPAVPRVVPRTNFQTPVDAARLRNVKPKPRQSALAIPPHLQRAAAQGGNVGNFFGFSAGPPGPPLPPRGSPPHADPSAPYHWSVLYDQRSPDCISQRTPEIGGIEPPGPPGPPDKPSDDSDSSSSTSTEDRHRNRRPHRHRRRHPQGPPDPEPPRCPQVWQRPHPLHIDPKLKISDLPEFTGHEDDVIPWFAKVNGIAEQSIIMAGQLGQLLPLQFKERAFNWYHSLPALDRNLIVLSWQALKKALISHFMTPAWCAKMRTKANHMHFREAGETDGTPSNCIARKKMYLVLLQPMAFDQLIHKILLGAPQAWNTILRVDDLQGEWTEFSNRVAHHEQSLIKAKNSSNLQHRIERLERGNHKTNSHLSRPNNKPNRSFKKDRNG